MNSARDLPRTIGTPHNGLREFTTTEIRMQLEGLSAIQMADAQRNLSRIGTTKFQIWGLPTGAKPTLEKLETGDYLMLLDSNADWGAFRYVGRVLYYLPGEQWSLSLRHWKEKKFPLILLLRGHLITYPWNQFLRDFKFGAGMKPMGRTYRISDAAFSKGPAESDQDYFEHLRDNYAPHSDFFLGG